MRGAMSDNKNGCTGGDPTGSGQPTESSVIDGGGRVVLTGISSRAFEHPADRAALLALRSLTGFDQLIKMMTGLLQERQYRLAYLASSIRVDDRQFPKIDEVLTDILGVLDVPERPELYVFAEPSVAAVTLGVDKPFIALSSGLVELLDAEELRFALGHEVGHAVSGHALYRTLLMHLLNLASLVGWVPVGGLALRAVIAALREWERKSELSADRAGLLAGQDVDAARRAHMKIAGGDRLSEMNTEAFLAQAEEYQNAGSLRDGILKLLNTERSSHPFSAVRALELRRWVEDGEYADILVGHYPRRTEDGSASFADSARAAASSYRERWETSSGEFAGALRQVGDTVGQAAGGLAGWFGRQMSNAQDEARSAGQDATSGPAGGEGSGSGSGSAWNGGSDEPPGEGQTRGESPSADPFGSGTEASRPTTD